MSTPDVEKIEQLLKNATNPRQRAMAESLLKKINEQQTKTLETDTPDSQPQTAEVEEDELNND